MTSSYLLAVDGSPGSQKAIEFAAERAASSGASLIVAYVIEWSPYSFNTPEENETRHKRREEEIDRATQSVVEPCRSQAQGARAGGGDRCSTWTSGRNPH